MKNKITRMLRAASFAQGLDVVAVGLALERGALAKPAAGRHASESHGLALGVVAAHLEQALHHAKPISHRPPETADIVPRFRVAHQQGGHGAFTLGGLQRHQPGNAAQLGLCGRATALVQGQIVGHARFFGAMETRVLGEYHEPNCRHKDKKMPILAG